MAISEKIFIQGRYAAQISLNDSSDTLVYSFDNAGSAKPFCKGSGLSRSGWGFEYLKSKGLNVVTILASDSIGWYRSDDVTILLTRVINYISHIKFKKVISYGGSMGGYAAATYSSLLSVDVSILLNPITTLNSQVREWEYRYNKPCFVNDWNGAYSDSIVSLKTVSKVYVVYDPFFMPDRRHAQRIKKHLGDNCVLLKFRGVGHKIPKHLLNINALNWFVDSILNSQLDEKEFCYKLYGKRFYQHHYEWLISNENEYRTVSRTFKVLKSNRYNKNQIKSNYDLIFFLYHLFLSTPVYKVFFHNCKSLKKVIAKHIFK